MKKQTRSAWKLAQLALAAALLTGASGALADENAAARFRGAPTYDFGVTNVKWEAGSEEYSFVTFDLSWSFSWRAKWTEPATTSVTGKDIEVENWDAAWVFVKFLPEKDSEQARERNHWQHATLASDPSQHVMPAGTTNTVKLSEDGVDATPSSRSDARGGGAASTSDGSRGMGVFIYRDKVGHGVNDWKGIKLRWNHGADQVAQPAKAAVAVHPIAMVYVPTGPFKIGAAVKSGFSPFADGPDIPIVRYDGEQSFNEIPEALRKIIETTTSKDGGPYLQWDVNPNRSCRTDGGWRGGPTIPFLVDAEWNAPVRAGTRARGVGPVAGQLWSTHTFSERGGGGGIFGSHIGGIEPLNDDFPTGYDAFYCMKYELTQGQYVDFLNSLPPDVAAGRAFVSSEVTSDAGMHSQDVKVDLGPDRGSYTVRELAGHTIRSSADVPAFVAATAVGEEAPPDEKQDGMTALLADVLKDTKSPVSGAASTLRPVYMARCPFRRIPGISGADTRAYAVWAGLRPMSELEGGKAGAGPRDPMAPADWATPKEQERGAELLDPGLPTERLKGRVGYGSDLAVRVGCYATPTSDRGAAHATYWGISELGGPAVGVVSRGFRGTHGNGTMPAGTPGAPVKRGLVPFKDCPPDWPVWGEYLGGRFVGGRCRLVASADNRIKKPVQKPDGPAVDKPVEAQIESRAAKSKTGAQFPPADARRDDIPRVANVKVEPGKEFSTVSFDLAWQNSWRAKWTEPAEKNVTGKPLPVESWDAAWVFVKFRPAGAPDDAPAMLSANAADHSVPAGAALDVGLNDDHARDAERGVGVFIYRNAVGVGPNDFKSVKLRWPHGAAVDPTSGEVKVHALAMVCIPEGPFASRSPWGHALTIITTPDATAPGGNIELSPEERPLKPEWPNGFISFYCMKYSVSQGQYASMLNSVPSRNYKVARRFNALAHNNPRLWHPSYYGFNGYTINTNAAGMFTADVPDRMCPLLTEADFTFFTVWAGLRLMTDLEYEKACRGPRAVAKGGDAWTLATCGPAAGLDKAVLAAPSAVGVGPSYWGLRELSLSGCVQEWPSVAAGAWGWCKKYEGTHGTGAMEDPDDWPWGWFANLYYGGIWRCAGYGTVGHWVDPSQFGKMNYELMDAERCGRYGTRAVRTTPIMADPNAPLQLDSPPDLMGCDIGIFDLLGRFRNDGDKPLKVEWVLPLPAACFPQGDASRVFTAAPKAVTPFKAQVILTSPIAKTAVVRKTFLPVQIRGPDGKILSGGRVRLRMAAAAGKTPVIQSLDGGKIELKVKNATGNPLTLAFEMPSLPTVRIGESKRSITVAAGGEGVVAFPVPRQWFPQEGLCLIPYRVTIGRGAALACEAAVELRTQTRWWIRRTIMKAKMAGDGEDPLRQLEGMSGGVLSEAGDVFTLTAPSSGWKAVTCGSAVTLGVAGSLPSLDSKVIGATRAIAVGDADAILDVRAVNAGGKDISLNPPDQGEMAFFLSVWVNDKLVFDSRPKEKGRAKPLRLRKGSNTVVVEWRSNKGGVTAAESVRVQFNDAKTGKPVPDVLFDMDKM